MMGRLLLFGKVKTPHSIYRAGKYLLAFSIRICYDKFTFRMISIQHLLSGFAFYENLITHSIIQNGNPKTTLHLHAEKGMGIMEVCHSYRRRNGRERHRGKVIGGL